MAMMCNALFAARSPPRLSRWRTVFPDDAGTGLTPHSDAKLASDRSLSGLSPAVRRSWAAPMWPIELRGDKVRRQLIDDGGDHHIEIRNLVVQLKVTSGEQFEADAIGGIQIAICCQIRPPGGQRTDELHAGEVAQLIAKGVGSADDRVSSAGRCAWR